jgi:hypothetical protein
MSISHFKPNTMKTISIVPATLLVCLLLIRTAQAQFVKPDSTTNWKKKVAFGINFNQAAFSNNWKAGGVNSIGLNGLFNFKAGYAKGKSSWDNEIDFLYGYINNDGQGFRKTLDRIFLDTKYGYKINDKWNFFTSLNFLSQFTKGYKYEKDAVTNLENELLISDIFAPAFITSAWGVEYKPVSYFNVRLAPFAPRVTIVTDNYGRFDAVDPAKPYGVELGESTRFEWLAFQLLADFNKDIAKNVNLKWRYMIYANYETLEAKTIDHRLDLIVSAKVNQFINVNLGGILLYDFDQDSGVQWNQLFNIGFSYSFQNFADKK